MRPSAFPKTEKASPKTVRQRPAEEPRTEEDDHQAEDASASGHNWGNWRIEAGEDRGDGWFFATCPRCHGRSVGSSGPTLLGHLESGRFFCADCGHHGDASLVPSDYRGSRVDLTLPWWEPLSPAEAEAWLGEQQRSPLPVNLEVGKGLALVTDTDNPGWEEALVCPCRDKDSDQVLSVGLVPKRSGGELLPPRHPPLRRWSSASPARGSGKHPRPAGCRERCGRSP